MSVKVLVLVNRVPWPVKDGGTLAHYNLLKGLHAQGCELTIAALNTSKHHVSVSSLPHQFKQLGTLHTVSIDNRVKPAAAFANLFSKQSYHVQRFVSSAFEQLLIEILNKQTFDLIIFDGLYTAPYVDVVRAHSKAQLWLRQHNVEYQIWETLANQTKMPLKKWYISLLAKRLQAFEQRILNSFDALLALTEQDKQELQHMGCTKPIEVLPVGVEFRHTQVKQVAQPLSVFHLGAMDWQPNQQAVTWFIQEVWPKVIAKVPDAVFYVAGKQMPESFKTYQRKSIKIVGEVDDALAFMQSKQIMVVPLLAGSGIRVKILEGMSVGKAIVTTSLGAQGIASENGTAFLIADEAEQFAAHVVSLLQQPDEISKLGERATQVAHEIYDNNKVTQRLLNFYNTHKRA